MIQRIQGEVLEWHSRVFPNAEQWEKVVGLQEELGELAHAFLKRSQGVKVEEDHDAAIRDAVGDIVIFLMGFCNQEGIDLQVCIEEVWGRVSQRDYKAPGGPRSCWDWTQMKPRKSVMMAERKPVLSLVLADLTQRVSTGEAEYGEPLTTHNGRDALQDAYEEVLDLCLYLRQAIEERVDLRGEAKRLREALAPTP